MCSPGCVCRCLCCCPRPPDCSGRFDVNIQWRHFGAAATPRLVVKSAPRAGALRKATQPGASPPVITAAAPGARIRLQQARGRKGFLAAASSPRRRRRRDQSHPVRPAHKALYVIRRRPQAHKRNHATNTGWGGAWARSTSAHKCKQNNPPGALRGAASQPSSCNHTSTWVGGSARLNPRSTHTCTYDTEPAGACFKPPTKPPTTLMKPHHYTPAHAPPPRHAALHATRRAGGGGAGIAHRVSLAAELAHAAPEPLPDVNASALNDGAAPCCFSCVRSPVLRRARTRGQRLHQTRHGVEERNATQHGARKGRPIAAGGAEPHHCEGAEPRVQQRPNPGGGAASCNGRGGGVGRGGATSAARGGQCPGPPPPPRRPPSHHVGRHLQVRTFWGSETETAAAAHDRATV